MKKQTTIQKFPPLFLISLLVLSSLALSSAKAGIIPPFEHSPTAILDSCRLSTLPELAANYKKLYQTYSNDPISPNATKIQTSAIKSVTAFLKAQINNPNLTALNRKIPANQIAYLLDDPEASIFHQKISQLFNSLKTSDLSDESVQAAFKKLLDRQVPAYSVDQRIANLLSRSKKTTEDSFTSLKAALGELSLEDLQYMVHGGNPLAPSSDSWLGKYIKEAKAKTVVRRFLSTPTPDNSTYATYGPQKLVVAINKKTYATYQKYFNRPEFLVHFHEPEQGTLYLMHEGMVGSYAELDHAAQLRETGTILPHILLKTTEAQRSRQIFDFARQVSASNYSQDLKEFILEPWKLLKYCKMGGYNSCTHWVGNLQIGDIQVKNLKFPGNVDQYARNPVNSANPQIGPLRSYRNFLEDFAKDILRYMDDEERPSVKAELLKYINILQRIYKYPRGQMQLSELLGDTSGTTTNLEVQANVQGEYANPGYVATRLTGNVTTDRVPVIFLIVDDVTQDIPANFDPRISAY